MNGWGRRKQDSGTDLRLALVAVFPEPWQADIAVSLLVSEGIRAFPADDWLSGETRRSVDTGGAGVVVVEADAPLALKILQMAERGDLSLPEEGPEYAAGEDRTRGGTRWKPPRREGPGSAGGGQGADGLASARCPRCGSANTERRKGVRGLFSPLYRCRVCQWEWKERR